MFVKATKKPWRVKGEIRKVMSGIVRGPGDCVSVDQLQSPTPGLVAQLKGIPTIARYKIATVFIDHYSRLGYVHLQATTSSADTLEAKMAFERYCRTLKVTVKSYHADNGRFVDNAFINSAHESGQKMSYCGVNAHFQNGIAEKRIRDLQEQARTMLLHARGRWPIAITANLWPYAIRISNQTMNACPRLSDGVSPLEMFAGVEVKPRL